jgi:hypothetical protein
VTRLSVRLLRLLPPEAAHVIAIWAIRTGMARCAIVADALCTLAWAAPAARLLRWAERNATGGQT